MSRWYNKAAAPDITLVARLGDSIAYRDLPNDLKTNAIAEYFGATPTRLTEGGKCQCLADTWLSCIHFVRELITVAHFTLHFHSILGQVVCGSIGEVANDPSMREVFDVRSNEHTTLGTEDYENQKHVVWTEIGLSGEDQLRQRMAVSQLF